MVFACNSVTEKKEGAAREDDLRRDVSIDAYMHLTCPEGCDILTLIELHKNCPGSEAFLMFILEDPEDVLADEERDSTHCLVKDRTDQNMNALHQELRDLEGSDVKQSRANPETEANAASDCLQALDSACNTVMSFFEISQWGGRDHDKPAVTVQIDGIEDYAGKKKRKEKRKARLLFRYPGRRRAARLHVARFAMSRAVTRLTATEGASLPSAPAHGHHVYHRSNTSATT